MPSAETFRSSLRSILFENLRLKLFSLLIGFLLWFFISSEQMIDRIIEVPVEIINKPTSMEIANDYVKSVLLQIQTPQLGKENFSKNIVATLDLGNAHLGENVILLTPSNFRLTSSLNILTIKPTTVTIILEPLQNKTVPVKVRRSGKLAPNHVLTGIVVMPDHVVISGPISRVNMVKEISTQTIRVDDLRGVIVRFVNLVAEDPFISISYNDRVRVEIQIQERTISRLFSRVPIGVEDLKADWKLGRATATVLIKVPVSMGDKLKPGDLELYVSGSDCRPAPSEQEAPVRYRIVNPAFNNLLTVEKIEPEKVVIRVSPRSGPVK